MLVVMARNGTILLRSTVRKCASNDAGGSGIGRLTSLSCGG
jgi:hypothetical protein